MSDRCGEKEELSDGAPSHSVSLGMRWTVTGITQGAVSSCLDTHLQWQQSECVTSRINLKY